MEIGVLGAPPGSREARVLVTPRVLAAAGAPVRVQSGAGAAAGFSDDDWRAGGAEIVYTRAEVLARSALVLSVAPPLPAEAALLRPGAALVGLLDPVADADLVAAVHAAGAHAVDLDRATVGERQPIRERMAELAGGVSVHLAAQLLETGPSRGVLLGGVAGLSPAAVVILGAGWLGRSAARGFAGTGATVLVLDTDLDALRALEAEHLPRLMTTLAAPAEVRKAAGWADVLIGAVRVPGGPPPVLLSPAQGKAGAVWLDLSISEGGCIEDSRPVQGPEEAYLAHGVLCCPVPNLPSRVARTASRLLAAIVAPALPQGLSDPWLRSGRLP